MKKLKINMVDNDNVDMDELDEFLSQFEQEGKMKSIQDINLI